MRLEGETLMWLTVVVCVRLIYRWSQAKRAGGIAPEWEGGGAPVDVAPSIGKVVTALRIYVRMCVCM